VKYLDHVTLTTLFWHSL